MSAPICRRAGSWAFRHRKLRARKHERTKGGGAGAGSPRRAGRIVGSASADREIAKTRKNSETTEASAHATAPACSASIVERLFVGSPHPWRTEPPGKPTKTNAPNPPRIRSLPADGAFRSFSCFRVFAMVPSPTRARTPRPTHETPLTHRPHSSFRVFVCAVQTQPRPPDPASCAEIFRQVS